MDPVVHFEIPANDTTRAKSFYEKTFGWKIKYSKEHDYFMIEAQNKKSKDMPGINGGMMKRKMPDQPFLNYIGVASLDATLKKVQASGGSVVMPRMAVGDMGWSAVFRDPEGNVVGLFEPQKRPAAKKTAKKASRR